MTPNVRWIVLAPALALALAGCKREVPVTPPMPAPGAPTASAPTAPVPATPQPQAVPSPQATSTPPANAAASPVEAVAITSATLGRAINADKRVTAATDTFAPGDTIFITVETSGAAGANLTARWTYEAGGRETPVNEETQKVPPGGPSVTEFHVRKPDGWPAGSYQVVVAVNDDVRATKKFTVK